MVPKTVFLLLVLVSQAFAASVLQLRSLDTLASRQTECPICTSVGDAGDACTSIACACSSTLNSGAQACITCAVTSNPSQIVLCKVQTIIDDYAQLCPEEPALKLPPGVNAPTGCPDTSLSETGPLIAGLAGVP